MGGASSTPVSNYSAEVGTAKPGEGVPRRLTSAELPTCGKFGPEIDNLYSMFARAAGLYPNNNCFGWRPVAADGSLGPFEWRSYAACHADMLKLGSGVAALGLPAKATFGMYAANSMTFQICTIGMMSQGYTCVPIYDTLGEDIVSYEVNHAEMSIIFVEAAKAPAVAAVIGKCPTLKHVVIMGGAADTSAFAAAGVKVYSFEELCEAGAKAPVAPAPASGEDLAFIMYTSGTTGDPKGVCLKQVSITIGASYCAGLQLYDTDRYLSFLPLAHIFETMVEHAVLCVGGSVGFYNGNIRKVLEDILALKPTLFCGVPRVYQRFYDRVYNQVLPEKKGPVKWLLTHALETETAAINAGGSTFWGKVLGKLLGKKIHGGCVRIMISGAAPLPLHVHQFLVAGMGCSVIQGYGMTENCANATLESVSDRRAGHVGPPMPTMEIKLVDVPEMNYTSANAGGNGVCGEVCTRGTCNFAGYHKNKEETDKILEPDGWLHTGDIGRWNPDGTLSIIDRKKNIFKLSQGEYVAAEKIEMVLSKNKYIAQPWVYGNSFFPMLVAVITPDLIELNQAAKAGGWFDEDPVKMCAKPEAVKLLLDELTKEGKAAKLKSFELPKAVYLEGLQNELGQGFTIQNDCLTPTFKLKRPPLLKKYDKEVDAMYVSLGEDPSKFKKI